MTPPANTSEPAMPFAASADPKSLADCAYGEIKARIHAFALQPGGMVAAHDLARDLGMSVTPIHSALKRLCGEGLARVIARTGYVIAPLTFRDLQEIYSLRLALEPLAVDQGLRRAGDKDLERFHRRINRHWGYDPAASGVQRLNVWGERHDDFHLAVAELSGNSRLVRTIRDLLSEGRRLTLINEVGAGVTSIPDLLDTPAARVVEASELPTGPQGPHAGIADAVLSRDREGAMAALADHVREGHRRTVEALTALPGGSFVDEGPLHASESPPRG